MLTSNQLVNPQILLPKNKIFDPLQVKIAKTTISLRYTYRLWQPELRGSSLVGIENCVITKKGEIKIAAEGCKRQGNKQGKEIRPQYCLGQGAVCSTLPRFDVTDTLQFK